jgi:hypothetical protein
MVHFDLAKLEILDRHFIPVEWCYFLNRKNKSYTLQHAIENLKKRRAEYFLWRYDNRPLIIESFFGTKELGFYTYDGIIQLLENTGFYDDDSNDIEEKIVDIVDFKPKHPADEYDVKIIFSYGKEMSYTPCVRGFEVHYEDDDEETYYHILTTKIFFDNMLVCHYESILEMDYLTKYFVYNINKMEKTRI